MKQIHRAFLSGDGYTYLYNIEVDGMIIKRATIHTVNGGLVSGNMLPNPDNLSPFEQAALYNILLKDGVIKFPNENL